MGYILIFILLYLWFLLTQICILKYARSVTPNYYKAVFTFPIPHDIDERDFYIKKFLVCGIQDNPRRYPLGCEFKCTTNGVLIREFVPGSYFLKRKTIFIPWCALSEATSVKTPWYMNWFVDKAIRNKHLVVFEIKGTTLFLLVRSKLLDKSGFNSHLIFQKNRGII